MTPDFLQTATRCTPALAAQWADPLSSAMQEFDVTTPTRQAMFLAQVGHESGGFFYTAEIWGPTDAQARYEPPSDLATELGNTQPGDGYLFRGRGLIQITGRANYDAIGGELCLDCTNNPDMLATPEYAARSAGWFWQKHGLNALADQQLFSSITQRINGGNVGAADRLARYHLALAAFNEVA